MENMFSWRYVCKKVLNLNKLIKYLKNLMKLFYISLKINYEKNNNKLYFNILFIICLLSSILIRCNIINEALINDILNN